MHSVPEPILPRVRHVGSQSSNTPAVMQIHSVYSHPPRTELIYNSLGERVLQKQKVSA